MMAIQQLPAAFHDLESFATVWALGSETERHHRRLASSITEIRAFYEAILPRIDTILEYLNDFPLEQLAPEASNLLNLSLALAEIAPAVELFGQPEVPDAFDSRRVIAVEQHRPEEERR
jgi:hypothetical protein